MAKPPGSSGITMMGKGVGGPEAEASVSSPSLMGMDFHTRSMGIQRSLKPKWNQINYCFRQFSGEMRRQTPKTILQDSPRKHSQRDGERRESRKTRRMGRGRKREGQGRGREEKRLKRPSMCVFMYCICVHNCMCAGGACKMYVFWYMCMPMWGDQRSTSGVISGSSSPF